MFRYEWIWKKTMATGFLNAHRMPMKIHENVLVFYKKLPTYNPQFTKGKPYTIVSNDHSSNYGKFHSVETVNDGKRYPVDIVEFKNETGLHPTQKPVALCEYLINTYTNEGETVLDSCCGSGTVPVACINTNRNYIGFELDKDYFDVCIQRINNHTLSGVK